MAKKTGTAVICVIIAAILAGLGLFAIVSGITKQLAKVSLGTVLLWYFGGFILFMLAKLCKLKAGVGK